MYVLVDVTYEHMQTSAERDCTSSRTIYVFVFSPLSFLPFLFRYTLAAHTKVVGTINGGVKIEQAKETVIKYKS